MTVETTLLLYFGMTVVTYFTRRAFLKLPSHLFSPRLKNGLTFIPIGIFAALIFPSIFVEHGAIVWHPLTLVASVVCLVVMALSKNVFLSFGLSLLLVVLVTIGFIPSFT